MEVKRISTNNKNTYHFFGSSQEGDSGGLNYALDENKQVVAVGMFLSGSSSDLDNWPFNDSTKNKSTPLNYNRGIAFEGEVLQRLKDFSNGRKVVMANAKLAKPSEVQEVEL